MRHVNCYCVNCGDNYSFQWSGHGCDRQYNDREYCPSCAKLISDVLKDVPKKSKRTSIETDEVTLEQLESWHAQATEQQLKERAEKEAQGIPQFPICRRISPGLYNSVTQEHTTELFVKGRDEFAGRNYHAYWFPSEREGVRVTVGVRISIPDGKILEYV